MTDSPHPESAHEQGPGNRQKQPLDFRWQAWFQRARNPLFLLNRQRRILFVNRAWEELTGKPAALARGHICRRRAAEEGGPWAALEPPPEVLAGQSARVRRPSGTTGGWWDIDFLPFQDEHGLLGVLGKIVPRLGNGPIAVMTNSETLRAKLAALRETVAQRYRFDRLASATPALRRLAEQVRLASQIHAPVFLMGEAGTGKQWLARTIHHQGITRDKIFAAVDCARLPAPALTTALFGDQGLLRRDTIGLVYLKEPARLPRDLQVRLRDFLAEETPNCPRLVGGSATDPTAEIRAGKLMDDLYYSLSTLVIALPPLRERPADLAWFVEQFLERIRDEDDRRIVDLTPAALELLRSYVWPGNLRELQAVLAAAGRRAVTERIDTADLPAYLRLAVNLEQIPAASGDPSLPLDSLLEEAERRLIKLALHLAKGKKGRAAEILSVWRQRLVRRMEALGITDREGQEPDRDIDPSSTRE